MLKSPWAFKQYGESGLPVSALFPTIGEHCADDLCVVRSMIAPFSEHTNANFFLHTGTGLQGRPAHGAWVAYGLGSECQDLPAYVVLNGGLIPSGGLDCFGSGFLPAAFQGSVFQPGNSPVANITPREAKPDLQSAKLALIKRLDRNLLGRVGRVDQVESAISNYELAARMQMAVPELMDLGDETKATQSLYGMDDDFANTRKYGRLCLVARRMVERGVRFIELTCTGGNGDRWDQHGGLVDGHTKNSRAIDRPVAGLIRDLKQRGLLDETLIVWCGEFGRTPFAQGGNGRDHNPFGFSIWLAGGGSRAGYVHGATDEFGYHAVQDKVEVYDLHATMLHLMGMDHEKLTYRFSSRDMRLTDVHGRVVPELLG
ncbi:MAG: sulfatase [Planctomycetaceae bacterium]|nr:MAG: sulfatase [Planctomycetaceae bacterium]